jgi:hypothetical protein
VPLPTKMLLDRLSSFDKVRDNPCHSPSDLKKLTGLKRLFPKGASKEYAKFCHCLR